ncbi:hypothetical protein G6O69_09950 [Pseudenhygromyxa sp. WMMC2535]|uniref:hypothetical protein n=1 Tax=Pseudenhygromyxa sp. WMMC2535 TaxID=2712867 RepID=UPI0015533060|nr:hypothetical protein [Pseudenhygromyxa sp. WMMC2535]NVB38155.1 hypothetical protein [Pseudenhygromyxa sp. WMMC2535]
MRAACPALLSALVTAIAFGCFDPDANEELVAEGETADCPIGAQGCVCTGGGACDMGLSCVAGVCEPGESESESEESEASEGTEGETTDSAEDSGDTDSGDTGSGDTDSSETSAAACQVWELVYDLEGSVHGVEAGLFGQGDYPVEAPYDDPDTVGPGSMTIVFEDLEGEPGPRGAITAYTMSVHYELAQLAELTVDLENSAGPDACGLTFGQREAGVVSWEPPTLPDHHSVGEMFCIGSLFICELIGLEQQVATPIDELGELPLSAFSFAFAWGSSSFEMPTTQVTNGEMVTTWEYQGAEVSRTLVDAPDCLCDALDDLPL